MRMFCSGVQSSGVLRASFKTPLYSVRTVAAGNDLGRSPRPRTILLAIAIP